MKKYTQIFPGLRVTKMRDMYETIRAVAYSRDHESLMSNVPMITAYHISLGDDGAGAGAVANAIEYFLRRPDVEYAQADGIAGSSGGMPGVQAKYDVNGDRMLTLDDIELVRANLNKNSIGDKGEWASNELVRRCDLNKDGKIDIDNLAIIAKAYEDSQQ